MPEARMAPERLRLALGVLVLGLAPLLFLGGPDNHSVRSFKLAWQLGHPLLFFVLTWLLVLRWPRLRGMALWRLLALALAGAALLGGAIEWLQRFVGRESSLSDLRLDLFGAALAALLLGAVASGWQQLARRAGLLAVVAALVVMDVRPLLIALVDEYNARRAFPVLANFETPFEAGRWVANGPLAAVASPDGAPGHALRLELRPAQYAGFALRHFPRDWRDFRLLTFRVFADRAEPAFACRIHDPAHDNAFDDRYNQRFPLASGWTRIEIPLEAVRNAPAGRQMDLARVAELGCFIVDLAAPRTIFLDDVRLE